MFTNISFTELLLVIIIIILFLNPKDIILIVNNLKILKKKIESYINDVKKNITKI